jgi:outer membrane protein
MRSLLGGIGRIIGWLVCLAMLMGAGKSMAEEKPLWEIGMGVATVSFPSYRGSDEQRSYVLPVPVFNYHGDFLKSDRHGVRGSLFDSDRVDLNVSFALSPPVPSGGVSARQGMPDLSATLEAGPQVDFVLWRSANHARFLKFQVPLRAVYTLENHPKQAGWVLHPKFNLDVTDIAGSQGWNVGFLAGPLWGNARQHEYYYSMPAAYVTAQRPAYEAKAGYAGMQYLMSVSKRFSNYWVGAFARYDNLNRAVFEDSPLVKQKDYFAAGVAITWVLGASSTMVNVHD